MLVAIELGSTDSASKRLPSSPTQYLGPCPSSVISSVAVFGNETCFAASAPDSRWVFILGGCLRSCHGEVGGGWQGWLQNWRTRT